MVTLSLTGASASSPTFDDVQVVCSAERVTPIRARVGNDLREFFSDKASTSSKKRLDDGADFCQGLARWWFNLLLELAGKFKHALDEAKMLHGTSRSSARHKSIGLRMWAKFLVRAFSFSFHVQNAKFWVRVCGFAHKFRAAVKKHEFARKTRDARRARLRPRPIQARLSLKLINWSILISFWSTQKSEGPKWSPTSWGFEVLGALVAQAEESSRVDFHASGGDSVMPPTGHTRQLL